MRLAFLLLFPALLASAEEKAGYDSRGRIIALLGGGEIEAVSDFVAVLPTGRRISLKDRRVGSGPRNQSQIKKWGGAYELPDGSRINLNWQTRDEESGLWYQAQAGSEGAAVERIEFTLDIARDRFASGRVRLSGGREVSLTAARPAGERIVAGRHESLRIEDAAGEIRLEVQFAAPREVEVHDRWEVQGDVIRTRMPLAEGGQTGTMYLAHTARSYQLRVPLITQGASSGELTARFSLHDSSKAPAVKLALANRVRYAFDGFGGNFCWDNARGNSAIQAYVYKNLKHAWARSEMKIAQWDAMGRKPGPDVQFDLENMRRFEQAGIPYVISTWRLPERFYLDAFEKPRGERFRVIDPAKWDEVNDLIGSYLLFAKREYGVEPDLFSFNEPNIGVQVGQSPEGHTEQIKRMGAAFKKLGLKTKMLLADAVPARDSHVFALDAANDAEALGFIGGVGFHSWGGATPKQYAAWGDLAEWLKVPLLVTELGVDSQAFATNSWDSYHYGLREAQMTQEILLHARPQGTQFWQYTDDFALARLREDGTVEPTARFWMMKHFTDLTPLKSEALETSSDQASVMFTAFRKGANHALHIVNRGGAREAAIQGMPDGNWRVTETTEAAQFKTGSAVKAEGGVLRLNLPARSIVTLTVEK